MAWWGVLQARVVQVRHRAGVGTAWHQPSGSLRQRLPAVNGIARSLSHGATLARPLDPPQPVQLCRQWPGAVLQILQVAAAVERPAIEVAGPAPPIAGLRRARTGVVGLQPASAARPLPNPDPGARVISPGRPVFWRVTRSPPLAWLLGSDHPPSRRARPSRSLIALLHRTPRRSGPPGTSGYGQRPEGTTVGASSTMALPIARRVSAQHGSGWRSRPTGSSRVRSSRFSLPGGTQTGQCESWEQHIDDEER